MSGVRKFLGGVVGLWSELLDTAGLGLLVTSAFLWSPIAGFAAAGVGCLTLAWWLKQGGE